MVLDEVKTGLGINGNYNDAVILQKIFAVTGYMKSAGVSQENINSELGVACICVGVTDLWNLSSGEIKFSPAFSLLITQLALTSTPIV